MKQDMIYDEKLIKNGKILKKVYLNYVDAAEETGRHCDCCDENKQLASIFPLCGDAMCICKDCLMLIVNEFQEENNMKIINSDVFLDGGTKKYITDSGIEYCQDFRMKSEEGSDKVIAYPSVGQFFYGYPKDDGTNIITYLDLIQELKQAVLDYERN